MKKNLAKKITLSILAGAVLMSSSVVWAENNPDVAGWTKDSAKYVWKGVSGGAPNGEVNGTGNTFTLEFYGAYASSNNDATGGKVTISGGTFGSDDVDDDVLVCIYGGSVNGRDATGNAIGNTVTISGGTFDYAIVYGGSVNGINATGNAEGNTVTISGGTFNYTNVYGGRSRGGNAKGNTVNIGGEADLSNADLYGGYGGTLSDNVLNVGYDVGKDDVIGGTTVTGYKSWNSTKSVGNIDNFQRINFKNINWSDGGTVLKVAPYTDDEGNEVGGTADLAGTAIGDISVIGGTVTNGEYMNLISANNITGTISNITTGATSANIPVTVYRGVANKITLDGKLEQVGSSTNGVDDVIKLTITDTDAANGITAEAPSVATQRNDQVLVLGESRAAAVAFTNQGSELIETGLDALARDNSKDTKVFAAVYGNHSEYETGSHVNVNGWSGIVGIGKTNANGLTVGAFFENGEGNYSTHNDYNAQYIRGDGEANYNGGGLLVRKDNANGVYAEASLRAGNLQNELRNAVRNGQDLTGYDVDTFYYGAHIGIGKVIPRGADGDSLDVYGKFIYTHHDGETFDVGGTPTKFDSVESERLRLGFRLNEVQTNKLSMYYGAAWEYEFNGDAHDKIASFDLETPSLEGSTVIGEVGAHYKASEKWSLDLNARAYTGQREGFSGSVQANYSF